MIKELDNLINIYNNDIDMFNKIIIECRKKDLAKILIIMYKAIYKRNEKELKAKEYVINHYWTKQRMEIEIIHKIDKYIEIRKEELKEIKRIWE